ncbi:MAG: hypothetical protein LC781_06760 [Actinobacteria bacterium]|nr:hypothetical protein [Actinomycetota bacterium]
MAPAPRRGRDAVEELADEGLDTRLLVVEITDAASPKTAAAWVGRDFGRLDVLVDDAGNAPASLTGWLDRWF